MSSSVCVCVCVCVCVGGKGAYVRDKNTSARLCAKNARGGAYAQGGAHLRDTMVLIVALH